MIKGGDEMEITTLRYFLAAARAGNLTRAAASLHISQPTLSKQLKGLELELGKRLFVRERAGIRLTDDGELLRARAEDIVEMADRAAADLAASGGDLSGDIVMGCAESYGMEEIAHVMRELREVHPRVLLHLHSGNFEDIIWRLDSGVFDFAVVCRLPDVTRYCVLTIPYENLWGVLMRSDHELASRESITIDDLSRERLIISRQSIDSELPIWVGDRERDLIIAATYNLAYNAGVMVRAGVGVAIIFDRLIDTSPSSGLVFRPLSPRFTTGLYVIWRRYQKFSPQAAALLDRMTKRFEAISRT